LYGVSWITSGQDELKWRNVVKFQNIGLYCITQLLGKLYFVTCNGVIDKQMCNAGSYDFALRQNMPVGISVMKGGTNCAQFVTELLLQVCTVRDSYCHKCAKFVTLFSQQVCTVRGFVSATSVRIS
jgi:hypothetical protein